MKTTIKQQELLNKLVENWKEKGKGIIINKSNSRQFNNLRRMGLVEIYPAHAPIKGFYQSWEAFPAKELR